MRWMAYSAHRATERQDPSDTVVWACNQVEQHRNILILHSQTSTACIHLVGSGWHSRTGLCKDRAVLCKSRAVLWNGSSSILWHSSRWLFHFRLHCARIASRMTTMPLFNRWPLPQAGPLSSVPSRGLQEEACSSCTAAVVHSAMHFTSAAMPVGLQQSTHHQLLKTCAQEIEVV